MSGASSTTSTCLPPPDRDDLPALHSTYIFAYVSHVSYTDLRQNLARYLDQATESREPIVVTRQGGKENVVLIAEAEFKGWMETVHLLRDPANARHLLTSVAQADAGQLEAHELVPPSPKA